MLDVKKGNRRVFAMVMDAQFDRCIGVAQCALDGCKAYTPLSVEYGTPDDQIMMFLEQHECRGIRRMLH